MLSASEKSNFDWPNSISFYKISEMFSNVSWKKKKKASFNGIINRIYVKEVMFLSKSTKYYMSKKFATIFQIDILEIREKSWRITSHTKITCVPTTENKIWDYAEKSILYGYELVVLCNTLNFLL